MKRLKLRAETLRHLNALQLGRLAGGRPTSFPQCGMARVEFTDECPSAYTTCVNSCSD